MRHQPALQPRALGASRLRQRLALVTGLVLALCWCAAPRAGEPTGSVAAATDISAITLEHNCFGCPTGSVLVLRRNGTAVYTVTGNARLGTASKAFAGTLRAGEFDALARLAVAQGFFQLNEQYEDPQTRDGPWTSIAMAHGRLNKQVFRRDATGPAALAAVEQAIEAARSRIQFVAAP